MTTNRNSVRLSDKYLLDTGRIYLSGTQALVRLVLLQRRMDARRGLNTAGFVSGYRGSPLANLDTALWQAKCFLDDHQIHFQPGINEELAATAVWGSQQVCLSPGARVEGVFGLWYAKGPGVDRSMDALKHANCAGVWPKGGVLAVFGDDHGAQSSTLPHQSEQLLEAAMIPVLNPATVEELVEYGLYGFAMSRYSGCWVGLKATTEVVESSGTISADHRGDFIDPGAPDEPGGLGIRNPDPSSDQERRLHGSKMAAVAAFARANAVDRIILDSTIPTLGIVTTGKAYLDLLQALSDLGIDASIAQRIGLRVYKVGLSWPLEVEGALAFSRGLKLILVVEEKRAFVETQLVRIMERIQGPRPRVLGKLDEQGHELLPSNGELTAKHLARALKQCFAHTGIDVLELRQFPARPSSDVVPFTAVKRQAYFCSGCPHNTSTNVPAGSRALGGTGCHYMATVMPSRHTGFQMQMGGEGVNWIAQAPFTSEKHVFVNMGDGTYSHSGLLAIRASAAAKVNVTYKILVNDAVAMTGGQPADAGLTVAQIAHEVAAEGAKRIVIVAEDPRRHHSAMLPPNCSVRDRSDLESVQIELREQPGLSVLIYDQVCAAEKRRRRKRRQYPKSPVRVFINSAVCEGCGDCSVKSNCISVAPLETELGRKRRVDQSSCNMDTSCIKGFCPSFVTVHGGEVKTASTNFAPYQAAIEALPEADASPLVTPYRILVTGVGGTGVITVGALLGMAAHLDGQSCSVLDFTGLAQKNGPVTSHVQLAPHPGDLAARRIGPGSADLILAADMVVAAGPAALPCAARGYTRAIVNSHVQSVAAFVNDGNLDFQTSSMRLAINDALGDPVDYVDATRIAMALFGDSIFANLFILGVAFQKGLIPVSTESLLKAIELNGTAVETNTRAFHAGRLYAHQPAHFAAGLTTEADVGRTDLTLADLIEHRSRFLRDYQDQKYAQYYRDTLDLVVQFDRSAPEGDLRLSAVVARNLFKLMAYKDEYEVARLHTMPEFANALAQQFTGEVKLSFHLAPPIFAKKDPATGEPRKVALGAWILPVFKVLAALRRLRGTPFDIFGHTTERRMERRLVSEYVEVIRDLLHSLTSSNYEIALQIANVPDAIRGYGHVKMRNVERAEIAKRELLAQFQRSDASVLHEPEQAQRAPSEA